MLNSRFAKKVGLSFGRAFVGAFIVALVASNASQAVDLNAAKAALIAAGSAGIAAGIRAVQVLVTDYENA